MGSEDVCKAEIDANSNYVLAAQPPLWLQRKGAEPAACPLCLSPCPWAAVALLCPHCPVLPSSFCLAHRTQMEEAEVVQPACPVLRSCSSQSSAITCANYGQRFTGSSCPANTMLLCKDMTGKPVCCSAAAQHLSLLHQPSVEQPSSLQPHPTPSHAIPFSPTPPHPAPCQVSLPELAVNDGIL